MIEGERVRGSSLHKPEEAILDYVLIFLAA
jgi:hypothetical protein